MEWDVTYNISIYFYLLYRAILNIISWLFNSATESGTPKITMSWSAHTGYSSASMQNDSTAAWHKETNLWLSSCQEEMISTEYKNNLNHHAALQTACLSAEETA